MITSEYLEKIPDAHILRCQNFAYILLEDLYCTHPYEIRIMIIYSTIHDKSNVYILEVGNPLRVNSSICDVITYGEPLSLTQVQLLFPNHKFEEENYGF